jgi:hypothetical protein
MGSKVKPQFDRIASSESISGFTKENLKWLENTNPPEGGGFTINFYSQDSSRTSIGVE